MCYEYPLLHKVFSHFKTSPYPLDDVYLVCCQHLLEPQMKMFELCIDFGFKPENITVLGKAYSSNTDIVTELRDRGIHVTQPPFSHTSFDEEHRQNTEALSESIPLTGKIVLLDDGAQLITTFAQTHTNILFAVEQTSSGFRKLENIDIPFPVINVARSSTKLIQESPIIAKLCHERIQAYMADAHISQPIILGVGLGPIGENIFTIFKRENFAITGFDVKHGHTDLLATIQNIQPDIIIGATGSPILSYEEIDALPQDKHIHLISVSSSDREFPVTYFRNKSLNAHVHDDIQYKNVTFVNNGFPITFKGNRNELPQEEIEKTICLLGGSVVDGITRQLSGKGLIDVSTEIEDIINN